MRLAHLTDLHLPIRDQPPVAALLSKRVLGYLSWRRNRRFRHQIEALEKIAADCRAASTDFTAISGDLVNISLPSEFSQANQWVREHFDPKASAFCPGNHDAYVETPWTGGLGLLADYMAGPRGAEPDRPARGADDFPFVRNIGEVCLIFANSSPPTAPGLATGKLGRDQIDRIAGELLRAGVKGCCRVLVLHHPVSDGATPARKALDDRKDLRDALYETGVELVIHGHTHHPVFAAIETKDGRRPVIGGASASHPHGRGKYPPARYNIYTIERQGGGWRIDAEIRELDPVAGIVKTAARIQLLPAAP